MRTLLNGDDDDENDVLSYLVSLSAFMRDVVVVAPKSTDVSSGQLSINQSHKITVVAAGPQPLSCGSDEEGGGRW